MQLINTFPLSAIKSLSKGMCTSACLSYVVVLSILHFLLASTVLRCIENYLRQPVSFAECRVAYIKFCLKKSPINRLVKKVKLNSLF